MATPVTDVKGIGPATALLLQEQGISSAEDLAVATVAMLTTISGFSEIRARQTIAAANAALNPAAPEPVKAKKSAKAEKGKEKKGKEKKKKKEVKDKKKKDTKGKKKGKKKKDEKKKKVKK